MASIRLRKIFIQAAFAVAISSLYGCPVHDGTVGGGTSPGPTAPTLAGTTTLAAINGSSIKVFLVNADGSNGAQIGSGTTTNDGRFTITLTQKPSGPFRVCSESGDYTDESTGSTRHNNVKNFCALVPFGTTAANITPLTAFVDAMAMGQLKKKTNPQPADLQNALTAAQQGIQKFFALKKAPHLTRPVFVPPAAGAPGDDYALGALLGAYSQLDKDNTARCGGTAAQDRLNALIADIADGVFDGKTINPLNAAQTIAVVVACANAPGGKENLPLGTGTAELLAAFDRFAQTDLGKNTMHLDQQPALRDDVRTAVATGDLAPPQVNVVASQGLIAIDTANKIAYVPVYTWDANKNARIAVVDLANTPTDPAQIPTISLPGSEQPIASSFDPINHRLYVESRRKADYSDNGINVYVIDPSTRTVLQTIDAVGLSHTGSFGGIVANPGKNKVIVVGTNDLGVIDLSVTPPKFLANSVVSLFGTDSIALNLDTEILFNSSDGSNQLVDTSVVPATTRSFPSGPGTTDGVAFDNLTNVVILDPEFNDQTHVFNFGSLTTNNGASDAPRITVPGLGATGVHGEGPGGQAAINVLTHQGVVADEFGENFKLIQLPTAAFTGTADNNGQPGVTGPAATATSAFQIAASVIPKPMINGTATQLTMRGDPNSLSVNPVSNRMYALSDTSTGYNTWPANDTRPLFLFEADLSQPVLGASPTAATQWTPATRLIRLP